MRGAAAPLCSLCPQLSILSAGSFVSQQLPILSVAADKDKERISSECGIITQLDADVAGSYAS
jgi:hypothetical protein